MKILIVTPFFYPHVGGSQQYMEDLYACLVKNRPDIEADVLCYNTDNASGEEQYKGMHVYRIPVIWNVLPGQFALPNPVALLRFLREKRKSYDLIHVSTRFFDTAWWIPWYAKGSKTPVILTDHCADHPTHPNLVVSWVAKVIDYTIAKWSLLLYSEVFATNKAACHFLKEKLHIQSTVMYGGVDVHSFTPAVHTTQKRLRVLYVGRMIPSKGVELLFDVVTKMPEIDVIFAGPGALVADFKKRIADEKLNHIQILGSQSRAQVADLLRTADAFVHPSLHHEGFPNVLLEAGAAKLAVIATDVGGTKEIIIPGETGILLKPHDTGALREALQNLLHNPQMRIQLATALYTHIHKHFTWEIISEQLYGVLQKYKK